MGAPIPQLNLYGLQSEPGRKYVAPTLRVGITIYPLREQREAFVAATGDDRLGLGLTHPFEGGRSRKARTMSWEASSEGGIVGWTWDKQMGQPSGKWSLQVKDKTGTYLTTPPASFAPINFDTDVFDGDWADLFILRNGVQIPVCRGVVDSVREGTASQGGATVRTWTITGRDHGAFFEYPITWANIWAQTLGEMVGGLFVSQSRGRVGGSPDELFEILIGGALQEGRITGQWELPESLSAVLGGAKKRLWQILQIMAFGPSPGAGRLRGAYYNEPKLWTTGGQTLHQTISEWCNPLLNEWYYDLLPPAKQMPQSNLGAYFIQGKTKLRPTAFLEEYGLLSGELRDITGSDRQSADILFLTGRPPGDMNTPHPFGTIAAFIRERPFISVAEGRESLWFGLPTHKIPNWMIQTGDLGRGGHERYNLIELLTDLAFGGPSEQPALSPPVWNRSDIQARGLRTMSQTTNFLADFPSASGGGWQRERTAWQTLLRDWYGASPYLRQGTITFKTMLPELRIGQRLIVDTGVPETSEQFYIEANRTQWSWGSAATAAPEGSTTVTLTHGFRGTDADYLARIQELAEYWIEAL